MLMGSETCSHCHFSSSIDTCSGLQARGRSREHTAGARCGNAGLVVNRLVLAAGRHCG